MRRYRCITDAAKDTAPSTDMATDVDDMLIRLWHVAKDTVPSMDMAIDVDDMLMRLLQQM